MTKQELPKAYDFKSTEARIYAMWETGGFFKPHNDPNRPGFDPNVKPFVITAAGRAHFRVEDLIRAQHRLKEWKG